MDAPARRLWWKAAGVAVLAFAAAAAFSAYLRPDMLAAFGDLLAFCATLLR
ncbi:MAG: hypothetical protein HYS35_08960 [Betaproteobacteria bacterium]|nr:hypothetical protein [Betaproteobacteria bacterium]